MDSQASNSRAMSEHTDSRLGFQSQECSEASRCVIQTGKLNDNAMRKMNRKIPMCDACLNFQWWDKNQRKTMAFWTPRCAVKTGRLTDFAIRKAYRKVEVSDLFLRFQWWGWEVEVEGAPVVPHCTALTETSSDIVTGKVDQKMQVLAPFWKSKGEMGDEGR